MNRIVRVYYFRESTVALVKVHEKLIRLFINKLFRSKYIFVFNSLIYRLKLLQFENKITKNTGLLYCT